MALKDKWKNKVNGDDYILAEDINDIAEATIELEKKTSISDGYISANSKRITNLEKRLNDDLFVTGDMNLVESRTVPEDALPYAEIKKIYGGGYKDSGGILHPKKALRVESCEGVIINDITLDTSDVVSTMMIEKTSDGSFKFDGNTGSQESTARYKFAKATLPEGTWNLICRYVSGYSGEGFRLFVNNKPFVLTDSLLFIVNDIETVEFSVQVDGNLGSASNYIIFIEFVKGEYDNDEFVPVFEPIATFDIPREVRNIKDYGFSGSNYLDLERRVFVRVRSLVNNTSVLLGEIEEVDVSQIIDSDNFIKVVPNGIIRVIQDTGEIMPCKCEVTFMVRGED